MRPLILTSGPAVGKTICGRALALERDRAAYIDVDDMRQLIVAELRSRQMRALVSRRPRAHPAKTSWT